MVAYQCSIAESLNIALFIRSCSPNHVHLAPGCTTHSHKHDHHKTFATAKEDADYAFEMATSNIRYGKGVTKEVGMDLANMKAKKGTTSTHTLTLARGRLMSVMSILPYSRGLHRPKPRQSSTRSNSSHFPPQLQCPPRRLRQSPHRTY